MSLKRKKPVDEDFEQYDDVDMLETSENEEDFSEDKVLRSLHLPQKHHHAHQQGTERQRPTSTHNGPTNDL
ncbi:uncharacterized protein G6M90_00g086910 [Metarhizium brunneum]|uniref:Uncharacterized protein n=1 Tax=Metarhizium brunneum TaxID=500148 RepID=A0A7D5ZBT4_9HYPO|nr:hypothetical protein G6M90_00g086910 [Metarhizium brunneum]